MEPFLTRGHKLEMTKPRVWVALFAAAIVSLVAQGFSPALAQSSAKPSFEVASVKPNNGDSRGSSLSTQPGGRFTATNVPLTLLVRHAFDLQPSQLVDLPDWASSERFDIAAKAESPVSLDERWLMLRALLEDRFKVRIRTESSEGLVYALVMARSDGRLGPDIRRSNADCDALSEARKRGDAPAAPLPKPGEQPICGAIGSLLDFRAGGFEMSQFTASLAGMMRQTVVDRTGLVGRFDLHLRASPEEWAAKVPSQSGPELPPLIFTAVQEQLGLKLDPQRGPVERYIIDRAELPTPD